MRAHRSAVAGIARGVHRRERAQPSRRGNADDEEHAAGPRPRPRQRTPTPRKRIASDASAVATDSAFAE